MDGTIVVGWSKKVRGGRYAFAYDLAAAEPVMLDLGTLGGTDSDATAVDGSVGRARDARPRHPRRGHQHGHSGERHTVVGSSHTDSGESHAFADDLAAAEPVMLDLSTLKGLATTRATAIDGDIVTGYWSLHRQSAGARYGAFAYDLTADNPRMLGLGTWRDSRAGDVDGDVVVGSAGRHATAWILRKTTRPTFAFQRIDQRPVKENAGRVTIRVTRLGRTDRAVTVRHRTRGGTAKAGQDFVATSGKLRFPQGVTRRSFTVKILNDRRLERPEHLLLTLARPSKPALLGTPNWSQLRIKANTR